MANTLTVLMSQMRRDFAEFTDPKLRYALERHARQIVDFGALHRILSGQFHEEAVSTEKHFQYLCCALARCVLAPIGVFCEASIAGGTLEAEKCERLGLIITELVTNAAKHAFKGRVGGRVRVELMRSGLQWLCQVSDNGIGMRDRDVTGSHIVDGLVASLNGQCLIGSSMSGTKISIAFPA